MADDLMLHGLTNINLKSCLVLDSRSTFYCWFSDGRNFVQYRVD